MKTRRRIPGWHPFRLGGLLAIVALLVGLQTLQPKILARMLLPTRDAQWIWMAEIQEPPRPAAFHAVKEFELPRPPTSARLLVLADEEAVVFLNDHPVAAIRYVDNPILRAYDVQALAHAGRNRLLAEIRSSRGVGGFLLRLEVTDAEGRHEIVSDSTWQIHRRQEAPSTAQVTPAATESPRVWGPPPIGRWGWPRRVQEQPTILQLTSTSEAQPALRYRIETGGGRWQDLDRTDRNSPALGSQVTFDWGREIVAYVALRLPPKESADQTPIGLLFAGSETPSVQRRADGYLVAMPGQTVWLDATPRRFRYITFLGLSRVSGADAYLVDPALVEIARSTVQNQTGAFGLLSTNPDTSLESEIRRQLSGKRPSSS